MRQEVHSFRFPLIRFLNHHTMNTIPAIMAIMAITIAAVPKSIFTFSHFVSFLSTGTGTCTLSVLLMYMVSCTTLLCNFLPLSSVV